MTLDTKNPATWTDLSEHPTFCHGNFEPEWYDGNLHDDLKLVRYTALRIAEAVCGVEQQLVVLDDCTFFIEITINGKKSCEVYPAETDSGDRCLFLMFISRPELEIQVNSAEKAQSALLTFTTGGDLEALANRAPTED